MGYAKVSVKMKTKKVGNKQVKKAAAVSENQSSELNEPRWSVVTFESCAASNLTYTEAAEKLKKLHAKKVSGLCIISDEAAERLANSGGRQS